MDPRAGNITFKAFFYEWSARQVWTAGTLDAATRAVLSTTFKDLPLAKIAPEHVEQWVKEMTLPASTRKEGLAVSTQKMRLAYVKMTFAAAVRGRRIAVDPSADVKIKAKKKRADSDELEIPTSEQIAAVLEAADVMFRPFIAVCAFAGLRLGEAAGLQVGDVDFLRRTIKVRRQVQGDTNSTAVLVPPKADSTRTIYVPEELTTMLAKHVEEVGTRGEERFLFSNGGHLFNRNSAGHYWREAAKAAGLKGFTLHSLRHYFASGLIRAGCDVVTVQRAMGHSQPSITLDVYSSLWPKAEDRTRSAAAAMMAEVLAPADSVRTRGASAP
ncbi:MAG TPA: site-specific integrase [Candidatus Janibacter merdipullorum]|nr:site-specific integrase [Candidatus Janibacter merdipullorum]